MSEDSQPGLASRFNEQVRPPPDTPTALPVITVPSVAEPSPRVRHQAWQTMGYAGLIVGTGLLAGLGILLLVLITRG